VYVTRILNRGYIKVAGVDFGQAGAKAFVASVANGRPGGAIELRLDRVDGPVIGTVQVGTTGATGQWRERTATVSAATGVRDLFLVFKGSGDNAMFDFDYWRFEH
jgi:hypothetical protein